MKVSLGGTSNPDQTQEYPADAVSKNIGKRDTGFVARLETAGAAACPSARAGGARTAARVAGTRRWFLSRVYSDTDIVRICIHIKNCGYVTACHEVFPNQFYAKP